MQLFLMVCAYKRPSLRRLPQARLVICVYSRLVSFLQNRITGNSIVGISPGTGVVDLLLTGIILVDEIE